MSQLAAIQPPGRQFAQRGNPAGFRLGAKLRSACKSFFRGDAGRKRRKSCAQEPAPADAPRRKWIVRHLFPLSVAFHRLFKLMSSITHVGTAPTPKSEAVGKVHSPKGAYWHSPQI